MKPTPDAPLPKHPFRRLLEAVPSKIWTPLGIAFVIFVIAISLFATIAEAVTHHQTTALDDAILLAIHSIASPQLDVLVTILTQLGSLIGVVALTAGIAGLFVVRREWRRAAILIIAVGGASALNLVLKVLFARTRPDLWTHLVKEASYSFPSGHAMASMALAAGLVVALWHSRYRWHAIIAGGLYALVIAFTRLYLGVHFPTDIIAGWCVSIAWALAVKGLFTYRIRTKVPGINE
jgi:undecaprenyl-diphosphatase